MGKAVRAKTSSTPRIRPTRQMPWRWITALGVVAAAVIALLVWQGNRPGSPGSAPAALTHVHGLGVNPADGSLYVATHDGLYQLTADGKALLAGTGRQDTMGFTVAGPNHFLASGHPAPGQGGPPHLGLIESSNAGTTWTTKSLAGQADFHTLRFRHHTVYGYNSTRGQLITSTDQTTWQTRARMSLRDFDISPTDPSLLLAITDTGLQRSSDSGATWIPAGGPPMVLLAWETADRLWGLTSAGDILRSADSGTSWNPSGNLAGQATAFAAGGDTLYAAVHERGIFASSDAGTTWTKLYA